MTSLSNAVQRRNQQPFERPFSIALHGLRGAAALSVFVNHFFDFLSYDSVLLAPLHCIDDGLSAVALFFVLSGTVLGISLRSFQLKGALYVGYAAKRAFRLLPMIIVSCSIGFLYTHSVGSSSVGGRGIFAPEFYNFYQSPLTVRQLFFSWTGLYSSPNPPLWSIYVEIVASALLPFFVLCSRKPLGSAVPCACLLVFSFATSGADGHFARNHWPVYMVNFSVGLLLCHIGRFVTDAVNNLSGRTFALMTIALYVLLMNGRTLLGVGHGDAHGNAASNLLDLTIASILIVLLMERRANWAPLPLLRFLGDISYPLYALHWPILCFLLAGSVQLLGTVWIAAHIEIWTISMFVGSALLLVALAWGGYWFLERPAIAAGKRLTNSLTRRTRISPRMADSMLAGGGGAAATRTEINGV